LVDLGAWLTEQRAIPDDSAAVQEGSAPEEQAPKDST
jgi:endogenous inhibitor of DNA gyrase (YacG/DUF329 family)